MNILFAVSSSISEGPRGLTSPLASARYRAIIPAEQLARRGHKVHLYTLPTRGWPREVLEFPCDVVVISKSHDPENERLAKSLKERGARVVVDICDDDFDDPAYGPHFRRLVALADQVVASTEPMCEAIRRHTGRDAMVATDPVEGVRGTPRFRPRLPALNILWFGIPPNIEGVAESAGELLRLADAFPVRLSIVSNIEDAAIREVAEKLEEHGNSRVSVDLVAWSPESTWQALESCDFAWIPHAMSHRTAVKSPNRLLECLWAGRVAIADAIPSYVPYHDLVPVGQELPDAFLELLEDVEAVESRIRCAQDRVARRNSPISCRLQWARAVGDREAQPLRLNLGCGDKILPGFVNVDIAESRAGPRPDLVCDLRDLSPFEDGTADEILSVHVVEHFWRWEVRDVLREWIRVLKPGGKMILECPNLLSACRTLLEDPDRHSREDRDGQRSMWVLYGDPAWKDPLMVHRWGYTPDSLKALLEEVGLIHVRQEPALFKLREPRDMRIVGTKP